MVHNFINTGFTFKHIDAYDKSTSSLFRQVLLQKNISICNLFLQHDIKLNILDRQNHALYDLLFMSFKKNDIEMSRIFTLANLLYRTYNTSKFNVANLFLLACHFNHLEIVKFFFTEEFNKFYPDFDIAYQDDYGQTGLIMFTKNKNLEGIKFLMNHDPKRYETINRCNNSGKSALVIACEHRAFRNLENVKDPYMNHCNDDIIIYLLKNGSNLNQVTNYNTNPLSLSIERNNIEIISILINLGANLNNINNLHSYLNIASKWNNMELYQLIDQLIDISINYSAESTPIILRRIRHSEKNILLF
jgi:ankyrin repeat protein